MIAHANKYSVDIHKFGMQKFLLRTGRTDFADSFKHCYSMAFTAAVNQLGGFFYMSVLPTYSQMSAASNREIWMNKFMKIFWRYSLGVSAFENLALQALKQIECCMF